MTSKQYRNLLIESTVSGIGKMEIYKSPADKIIDSFKDGEITDGVRNCEDAIAVLGRIYDNDGEDRPFIHENDEEHEAQGDSEISVDFPDAMADAPIQNISDVIDDGAGVPPGNDDTQDPEDTLAAEDGGLEESFILEDADDSELDLSEDEIEDDAECPECHSDPCVCDDSEEEDELPEDEIDDDSDEVSEDDEELPEDEIEDDSEEELPEDEELEDDSDDEVTEDDEELPEDEIDDSDEDEELPEDEESEDDSDDEVTEDDEELPEDESDDTEDLPEDVDTDDEGIEVDPDEDLSEDSDIPEGENLDDLTENVDDSELAVDEQTGEDAVLAKNVDGDEVIAEPIPVDGEVYDEAAEDPAIDPNEVPAPAAPVDPVQAPVDPNAAPAADPQNPNAAPVDPAMAGDPNAAVEDPNAAAPEGEAPVEDPTQDPNEQDPVLDIDSQVVAADTTKECGLKEGIIASHDTNHTVLESFLREMKASDEAYMTYESDDAEMDDGE